MMTEAGLQNPNPVIYTESNLDRFRRGETVAAEDAPEPFDELEIFGMCILISIEPDTSELHTRGLFCSINFTGRRNILENKLL